MVILVCLIICLFTNAPGVIVCKGVLLYVDLSDRRASAMASVIPEKRFAVVVFTHIFCLQVIAFSTALVVLVYKCGISAYTFSVPGSEYFPRRGFLWVLIF